jgi:hypothetical protein
MTVRMNSTHRHLLAERGETPAITSTWRQTLITARAGMHKRFAAVFRAA